jgi:hypothetical protein
MNGGVEFLAQLEEPSYFAVSRILPSVKAGNVPLPDIVLAPVGAGAAYDALNDR